ncbi:hypothetical protein COW36_20225 [bacterium (Candidatus Blackallbacteria) CG17_big_fil_post_rev_8_21_14_2_50_48_46]|uniref:Glycoside hydrolase family 38 central domain-containing protein n=1 Tax=bacterium (Candidatus Blackallbacteria) CG17_big_fil_post_rev_8_21_14_2_50_48_46 TaxID=2014261 RepID=A0A2M7FZL7_9BACT|nr:MAG: hypothetical protein COW64_22550 [bacterium (Candidatus Blackallbacteria) CG18_big_fil_WC_8_21_14_2_50_49_26]PIW14735.1 MAG: hypothetical protein COW36_20225 [bacterium (Candidatus Blackallbacteria) CG17_big_fil_post_rev_8_21_14_2_50_48_46]PIW50837.1 MAG: hypothetical protein COW20_01040 [bacterium (Candidatus Blackallbacteria) CG13_big_fil_rev_8_21_14_2_50_49_14]
MNKQVYLYLHTHWDREWYRSFESYRFRLCQVVRALLDTLEQDPQRVFMLDGQTAVVEDFLEVYPQEEARLMRMIASGQLEVGPWYVLPDEFLVSGEALIRNLLLGREQSQAWGQKTAFGYLPDMFGHLAQMPQLLKKSGLEPAILWRGVRPSRNIFFWSALDGSSLTTLHLTKGYYMDAFHTTPFPEESFKNFLKGIEDATPVPAPLLMPVGGDHLGLPLNFEADLEAFNSAQSWYTLKPASIGTYLKELEKFNFSIETVHGELRNCESAYILPGVLSTRRYLKQFNDRIQNLLTTEVEPLLLWNWLKNSPSDPAAVLKQAWKHLLKNHPHDSICGCSIDEVHQDMLPRFRAAESLGQELKNSALNELVQTSLCGEKGEYLHLINAGPVDYQGCLAVSLEFPAEMEMQSFSLLDPTGNPLVYEILERVKAEKFVAEPDILPHWEEIVRYECLLTADIPAFSSRVIKINPHQTALPLPGMRKSAEPCAIENAWCRVRLDSEKGQLQFYRQENHTWIRVLEGHLFVDEGDAGDSYTFSPPQDNPRQTLHIQEFQVEKQGLSQTLHITYFGFLPAQLREDRQSRSGVNVPCKIQTRIRLYANDPGLYFTSWVQNQARDHRLRLLFKSQLGPIRCWSSTAFGALERQMSPPRALDVLPGKERPADTFPFDDWIHIHGPEDLGYVVHTEGLHEAELMSWEGKPTLALTFLRAVGWLSRDDLRTRGGGAGPRMKTPEAQCLGEHRYDYRLALSGNSRKAALKQVFQWQHPPLVTQGQRESELPGLFRIKTEGIALSCLKKAEHEQAIIFRLVNLLEHPVKLAFEILFKFDSVVLTDPLETQELTEGLSISDQAVEILTQPFEILTFKILPQSVE